VCWLLAGGNPEDKLIPREQDTGSTGDNVEVEMAKTETRHQLFLNHRHTQGHIAFVLCFTKLFLCGKTVIPQQQQRCMINCIFVIAFTSNISRKNIQVE